MHTLYTYVCNNYIRIFILACKGFYNTNNIDAEIKFMKDLFSTDKCKLCDRLFTSSHIV